MGKTSKPLKILCVGVWGEEFDRLAIQGHEIHVAPTWIEEEKGISLLHPLSYYDLIMGPTCWRLLPEHIKYLSLALKEARATMPKKAKNK